MATHRVTAEEMAVISAHSRRIGVPPPAQHRTSSGASGGVMIDPSTVTALTSHFEQLLGAIAGRVEHLSEQTRHSVAQSHRRHMSIEHQATLECERLRDILYQIDELELEFDRIRRIQEIVVNFKNRVISLERRMR